MGDPAPDPDPVLDWLDEYLALVRRSPPPPLEEWRGLMQALIDRYPSRPGDPDE